MTAYGKHGLDYVTLFLVAAGVGYNSRIEDICMTGNNGIHVLLQRVHLEFDTITPFLGIGPNGESVQRRGTCAGINLGLDSLDTKAWQADPFAPAEREYGSISRHFLCPEIPAAHCQAGNAPDCIRPRRNRWFFFAPAQSTRRYNSGCRPTTRIPRPPGLLVLEDPASAPPPACPRSRCTAPRRSSC
mgnify:CR=1 FL=1